MQASDRAEKEIICAWLEKEKKETQY